MDGGFGKKPEEAEQTNDPGAQAAAHLKSFIQRIEKLEEQQAELATDKRSIYAEADAAGYESKIIREVIKLRKLTPDEREDRAAKIDLYLARIGDLGGTPLGNAALKKLMEDLDKDDEEKRSTKAAKARSQAPNKKPGKGGAPAPVEDDRLEEMLEPAPSGPTQQDLEEAFARGAADQKAGKKITDNGYPPFSKTRAAWEEGWMSAAGSEDGMEAPSFLRRKDDPKNKKPKDDAPDGNQPDFMPPPGEPNHGDDAHP